MTTHRDRRRARTGAPQPDRLADAVRAVTRQAVADGQAVVSTDAPGLIRLLRDMGLGTPGLSPAAPVVGRLIAEFLVLNAAPVSGPAATETKLRQPTD